MHNAGNVQVQVTLELGHTACCRKKPTAEGFTHDWKVFVRGQSNCDVSHFVEKVQFRLHESFAKPKRVVKDPPYFVEQSGYGGFVLPVEIYFRNKEDPKKVQFNYDLFLPAIGLAPINNIRSEALTFTNPTEEFKRKLLKGGGIIIENGLNGFHRAPVPDSGTGDVASKKLGEASHDQADAVPTEADKARKTKTEVSNSAKNQEQTSDEKTPALVTAKKKPKKKGDTVNPSKGSNVGFIPLELLAPGSDMKDKFEDAGDVKLKIKPLTPKSNGERKRDANGSSELNSVVSCVKKRKLSVGDSRGRRKSKDGKVPPPNDDDDAVPPAKKATVRRGSDDSSSTSSSSSLIIGNIGSKSKNLALGALLKEMEVDSGHDDDDDDDQLDVVTPFQSNRAPQRDGKGYVNGGRASAAALKKDLNAFPEKCGDGDAKSNGHQDGWSATNGRHNGRCPDVLPLPRSPPLKSKGHSGDEASLAELLRLHKRLSATRDSTRLQKIVDILETTGAYSITAATFDFDLCVLDKSTIQKIESCLER